MHYASDMKCLNTVFGAFVSGTLKLILFLRLFLNCDRFFSYNTNHSTWVPMYIFQKKSKHRSSLSMWNNFAHSEFVQFSHYLRLLSPVYDCVVYFCNTKKCFIVTITK